jgi:hypothetical protein
MRANGLRRALIFPGQSLVIRGSAPSKKAPAKQLAAKTASHRETNPTLMTVAAVKPSTPAKAPATAKKAPKKASSPASKATRSKATPKASTKPKAPPKKKATTSSK